MIAYLYSRYPVVSQTFCDSEMLALERAGEGLVVASLNSPPDSFRHERLDALQAEVLYPPPPAAIKAIHETYPQDWEKLLPLIKEHDSKYGASFKAETRARNALVFAHRLRERGVRHIHVHFANRATHTALFLHALGFPFSFTAHAKDFLVDLGSHDLLREMADKAVKVIAVSDFSRGQLADLCPQAETAGKIVRVYNGIEPATFPEPGPPSPAGKLRVLSIGRLVDFKGFPTLIDAIAQVPGAELTIVGEGPERGALETLATGKNVALLGSQSQATIRELLADHDVFALACTTGADGGTDILPTVILEAMAAGLPVVATDFVGNPEMVADGKTGFLVPTDDPAALAAALQKIAEDPPRALAMGAAGKKRVAETFAIDRAARELLGHFAAGPASQPDPPACAYLVSEIPAPESSALPDSIATIHTGALPDGTVLEACWRRALGRGEIPAIDALRAKVGNAVSGEAFYRDARRALYLAPTLKARRITRVHAARSDSFLLAWLLAKLGGLRASFTCERSPTLPRSVMQKLAPDFAAGSVADARLAERLGSEKYPDALGLETPAPKSGLFSKKTTPEPDIDSWTNWLSSV